MTKILFSDLDETLLVNHHVPQVNRDAIKKMVKQGHKFVPCTGRAFFMIQQILDEVGLKEQANEYSICFNGGMIVENKGGKVLFYKGLAYEKVVPIFKIAEKEDLSVLVFTDQKCYIFNPEETEMLRKKTQGVDVCLQYNYDVSILKSERIAKALIINPLGLEALQSLYHTLSPDFISQYELTFSSNRYMEFNEVGVSKGEAVKWLANYLNLPIENTLGIGDNYNDMELIKDTYTGCVVSSGVDDLKKIAQYVCQKDYMDGSVAEVIHKFILED